MTDTVGLVGKRLGQYEILSLVGRGGMSVVYRARQISLGREVAVKVLNERAEPGSPFLERFSREARIIAELQHPHILPIYDFGQVDDYPYLVMRFVDGGSLNARLDKKPLSLDEIERLMSQVCAALDYAHSREIVHRDMKPHNVLLDAQGNAYLCDFGIAKVMGGGHELTRTGETVGTPTYMAPEQWQGLLVTAQSDVYSVGVMLFELLTGQSPFNAENVFSLMYKHLNDLPPSLLTLRPDLPPLLDVVVQRALAKLPPDRYASAGELARAFSAALRGNVASAPASARMGAAARATGRVETAPDESADTEILPTPIETGRAWVLDAFQRWRASGSPLFYLVGGHGLGKSTLLKRFAERLGRRVLHYELMAGQARSLDPRAFIAALATQLSEFSPVDLNATTGSARHELLTDPFEAFERQVLMPIAESSEPIYLLVDSLEAAFDHHGTTIVDLLRAALRNWPESLRMVVASVPNPRLDTLFRNARRLELQGDSSENRADLHATLSTRFATLMPELSGGEVDLLALIEKSAGNPLYLNTVTDSLAFKRLRIADLPDLPAGLEGLYEFLIARAAQAEPQSPALLNLLAVGRAPLSAKLLAQVFGESAENIQARLLALRPLAVHAEGAWRLAHPALRDFLATTQAEALRAAHLRLAEALMQPDPAQMSLYALQHLPAHYLLGGQARSAFDLLTDLPYLATRLTRVSLAEMADDFEQLSAAITETSDPDDQAQLDLLDAIWQAVQSVIPTLTGEPSVLFAQLYNRLIGVPGAAKRLESAAARWPHPWLRLVWPAPTTSLPNSQIVWQGAAVIALAAARSAGGAISRLSGDATAQGQIVWLAACADGLLRLWADGNLMREWPGAGGGQGAAVLTCCALSSDGKLILSGDESGTARLWDADTGALLHTLADHKRAVTACAFSLDGSQALTASDDRLLRLWDVTTGQLIQRFYEHPAPVKSCAFAMLDGQRLAISGDAEGSVRVWEVAGGQLRHTLNQHRGAITACAGLESGAPMALSGATDGQVIVWDLRRGAQLRALGSAAGGITATVIGALGGKYVALAASEDRQVRAWDVESSLLIARFVGHRRAALACALSPDGRVLSGALDGSLRVWDLTGARATRPLIETHAAEVRGCAFSPDARRLLTGSLDRDLRVWDVETGQTLAVMRGHTGGVNACAFGMNGRLALSASSDRTLRAWDTQRGAMARMFTGHSDSVTACAFSPRPLRVAGQGRAMWLIASGSADRAVRIWDAESGQTLLTLKGHRDTVLGCAFSPVDELLLSWGKDRALRLWSLETGQTVKIFEDERGFASCAFHPEGVTLAAGLEDGQIRLINRVEGTTRSLASATGFAVTACAFSASGGHLLSVSADKMARVWDVRKGHLLAAFRAERQLTAGAFAPDNAAPAAMLAVGDAKGTVYMLRLETQTVMRRKTSLL